MQRLSLETERNYINRFRENDKHLLNGLTKNMLETKALVENCCSMSMIHDPKEQLTWPLSDGSITAPNIKLAVGSTRSYITSAAAFTCKILKSKLELTIVIHHHNIWWV